MSRKVALLIGVSEYGEGIPSLTAPPNDVEAMKRVLENPEMGGFEVETLLNPDPTPMRKKIKKLFTSCGKGDLVLLFFSGHGITDDENKLYLATRITAKDDFDATAVPASFVQKQSKNSYTRRQVIILDCCYSGAFAEGWQAKSIGVDLKKELGAEGRVVLTSSTATQTSFQHEDEELSLYTQYLLEGIETGAADKDEDGKIHAHELHEYAKVKVQEVKPKQKPGIIIDREGFNILLSQAPVDDPELKFRKLVEKSVGSKGEISLYRRETLKIKQQEFNLTNEKADEIINSVLEPFRRHFFNLEQYKENYRKQVNQKYPLNNTLVQDLKDWGQQVLGLEDEDLEQIEQDINLEKKGETQHQQEAQRQKPKEYQQGKKAEKLKWDKEKRLRQQQQENTPSQPQTRKAGIFSLSKVRLTVFSGTTFLVFAVIFSAFLLNSKPSSVPQDTIPTPPSDNKSLPVQSSQNPTIATPSKPTLVSAVTGVDYGRLRTLLETVKWKEADQETTRTMLQAVGREQEGWLRTEDINKFSCEDLRIIDQLWRESSREKFGFSVQKDIYQNLEGTKSMNGRGFNFGATVGWSTASRYNDLIFDLNAPKGQLPSVGGWSGLGKEWQENGYTSRGAYGYIFSLIQRTVTCKA